MALTATGYLVAARYALTLGDLSELGAVFWPAAGVTVTALLVSPRRLWLALLVTVGLAELGHDLALGFPLAASVWWALANVLVGGSVAWLLHVWRAEQLEGPGPALRFAGTVLAVPLLGAAVGAIGTLTTDPQVGYLTIVAQWAIGDGLGILTLTPLGLLLCRGLLRPTRPLEAATVVVTTVGVTLFVFVLGPSAITVAPVDYLVLLPLLWAAARFGLAGSAVTVAIVALLANHANAFGYGPFANAPGGAVGASALLQLFLATAAVGSLVLASRTVQSERFQQLAAARAQLLSVVSHELRTPLTPILGFSELLLRDRDRLEARHQQAATVIHRNSVHLAAVIDDLLAMTRARSGGPALYPARVELVSFLRQLLVDHTDRELEATLDAPPFPLYAWVDPTHLMQIVLNLLQNAVRYGRPPVHLTVAPRRGHLEVAVTDHGDGVPAWFEPSLFDEFSQAEVSDRRPTSGLGLGLPIARDLAVANGGALRYDTAPTGGARFTIALPYAAPDGTEDPAEAAPDG